MLTFFFFLTIKQNSTDIKVTNYPFIPLEFKNPLISSLRGNHVPTPTRDAVVCPTRDAGCFAYRAACSQLTLCCRLCLSPTPLLVDSVGSLEFTTVGVVYNQGVCLFGERVYLYIQDTLGVGGEGGHEIKTIFIVTLRCYYPFSLIGMQESCFQEAT